MTGPQGGPQAPGDFWLETPRLVLRRPLAGDLDDYVRLHTDPRTYAHRPGTMPTEERCAERLAGDLEHWVTEQTGYAAVLDRDSGAVIGWAGLRVERGHGEPHLNLYFRLAHDRLGSGLGREVARALVAWGAEHRPDLPVSALVAPANTASLATCRSAGLVHVGDERPETLDGDADRRFLAPTMQVVRHTNELTTGLVYDLADLWVRVNDAGGAVGFVAGAPRNAVRAALEAHLAEVRADRAVLCIMRDPAARPGVDGADRRDRMDGRHHTEGSVRGFGFWHHGAPLPHAHLAWVKRLMVDPAERGRNLGRILLAAMVGVARRELPDVRLLRLDYRGGLGLGRFYASCGWAETGRVPNGLWLGGDDYRDDVAMARRVDGEPLSSAPTLDRS